MSKIQQMKIDDYVKGIDLKDISIDKLLQNNGATDKEIDDIKNKINQIIL